MVISVEVLGDLDDLWVIGVSLGFLTFLVPGGVFFERFWPLALSGVFVVLCLVCSAPDGVFIVESDSSSCVVLGFPRSISLDGEGE